MLELLQRRRPRAGTAAPAASLYLDLLKRVLTRYGFEDESIDPPNRDRGPAPLDLERRLDGRDWPVNAETMVGLERLENLQQLLEVVLADDVPGDIMETGVWRGGASIFMRGVLAAHGDRTRRVWLADSFAGLPPPDAETYPEDEGDVLHSVEYLAVSLDEVKANFERYNLLDDQVRFLPGWFRDTLPAAPVSRLSLLRLDGDLYESTIIALESLYPKVSRGGFVVVDDYSALTACRRAVDDFRARNAITAPLNEVDWTAVWWRRTE